MDASEHLRLLRIFHFAIAGLQAVALVFLLILGIVAITSGRGVALGGVVVVIGVFVVASLVLNGIAARRLPDGGRTPSIVAACLSLPSIPIGTAFGVYALMVHFKFVPEQP